MSISSYEPDYESYFNEPTEFDREVDSFKEALRKAVKQEITDELERLRGTVSEQSEKLANLTALESAAERKRVEYERKLVHAEREAEDKVRKEGIRKLLEVLAEPRYKVARKSWQMPQCDHCNEDRQISYRTPLGKLAFERCECAPYRYEWIVAEQFVHEVNKKSGELLVWYSSTENRYSSVDVFGDSSVLKSTEGLSDEELMERPSEYGYTDKEHAQRIVDALNEKGED